MLSDFHSWKKAVSNKYYNSCKITYNIWYTYTSKWLIIVSEFTMDKGQYAYGNYSSSITFGYGHSDFVTENKDEFESLIKKALSSSGENDSKTIVSSSTDENPYGNDKPYFTIYTDATDEKNALLDIWCGRGWTGTLYRTIMTQI